MNQSELIEDISVVLLLETNQNKKEYMSRYAKQNRERIYENRKRWYRQNIEYCKQKRHEYYINVEKPKLEQNTQHIKKQ